jgi:hypothetical protein
MNLDAALFFLVGGVIALYASPRTGRIETAFMRLAGARTEVQRLFAVAVAMIVVGGSLYGAFLALGCTLFEPERYTCSATGILSRVALVSLSFVAGYLLVRLSKRWLR